MFRGVSELVAARGLELRETVSEEEIGHIEETIGIRLPSSYRRLAMEYGLFEPIFRLRQIETYTMQLRHDMGFPEHLIPFYESEDEFFACFDASKSDFDSPGVSQIAISITTNTGRGTPVRIRSVRASTTSFRVTGWQ